MTGFPSARRCARSSPRWRRSTAGTIGAEFAHVSDTDERLWLQDEFQLGRMQQRFPVEERRNLLWQLTAAEGLERYLHTKYVGQKRFSLEGGEALIALLNDLIQQGGAAGIEEFVLGMAHRGRLNVLVNVLGKSPAQLFSEFEGKYDENHMQGSGDVKYHKGFSADVRTPAGNVHVALAFNPSHLEIVDPVVEGSVRARQERRDDAQGDKVVPVLMHGDAAFAGQGVVMETLQLSQARGYRTGGTLHIVINNQIGFTTSDPRDARSTTYCSDVAKMLEAPILHVNADDPEAVVFVTRLALRYRQRFHKDVVIDLVCYRRLGHNEADEPAATQPLMYHVIRQHPTVRAALRRAAGRRGRARPRPTPSRWSSSTATALDCGPARAAPGARPDRQQVHRRLVALRAGRLVRAAPRTGVPPERLGGSGEAPDRSCPKDLSLHPRVAQVMRNRARMFAGEMPLDWGAAETLAYASLLDEGFAVRLSGQDVGRGTFFHRHAVLHDQNTGRRYVPLQHVSDGQPRFTVIDSVLSEEAVLGFEYGYSTTSPDCLVIWEAQFGDFVNGAQVVIDQFISSGEAKWGRLVRTDAVPAARLRGPGPEHSSARLERFLQLCAENNMQVCVPSTPAQMFHLLRRQMLRSFRKPLIVMTPKSLLRHELSVSLAGRAQSQCALRNVIDEVDDIAPAQVQRVVFCSGKVYFDLLKARRTPSHARCRAGAHRAALSVPGRGIPGGAGALSPALPIWSGVRRSRRTRAPGTRSATACRTWRSRDRSTTPVARAAAAPATGLAKHARAEQRRLVETALSATSIEQTHAQHPAPDADSRRAGAPARSARRRCRRHAHKEKSL